MPREDAALAGIAGRMAVACAIMFIPPGMHARAAITSVRTGIAARAGNFAMMFA
jgi:hypothetical protein